MKRNIFCIFIFLSFTLLSSSYAEGPLQLKARAWPTKIAIGDEIRFVIQVDRPRSFSITPPSPKTSIAPFEIKSVEVSSYSEKVGFVRQTFLLKVTVFELGELQIPPMAIHYTDSRGRGGDAWTEPVKIKVSSVIKNAKDKTELRPIKGPVSLDLGAIRLLILSALALLLLVVLIIKVIIRRKNKRLMDLESLMPPHQRAMLELGRLEAKAFLSEGKTKEFYSELSNILRRYLDRRFQMETLEQTTFETLRNLKEKEFDQELTEKIREFLELSDLVKFAKLVPPRSDADRMTGLLKEVVEKTI